MSQPIGSNELKKTAVDAAAKSYWKLLFDTYGQELCADVPRRLKAAMASMDKIATIDQTKPIKVLAATKTDDGMVLEGMYQPDSTKQLLFKATLDAQAEVSDLVTIDIAKKASDKNQVQKLAKKAQ